jgi:hypothetical protein
MRSARIQQKAKWADAIDCRLNDDQVFVAEPKVDYLVYLLNLRRYCSGQSEDRQEEKALG